MGDYTEIYINVDLVGDVPQKILDTLPNMGGGCDDESMFNGLPERWRRLFKSGCYCTPNTSCCALTYDKISGQYSFLGKGDIKNYEREIQAFFDWIDPYIDADPGEFIGYMRHECDTFPSICLKKKATS